HHDADQERAGDGDADDQAAAQPKRSDDDNEDEQDGRDEAVLQLAQHVADFLGAVLGERDLDLRRPGLALLRHQGTDLIDGFDDVLTGALRHFDADRRQAVDAGDGFGVLEGAAETGDVLDPHDSVAIDLQRHVEDVVGGFEQARHLDREPTLSSIHRAGSDQPIGAGDNRADLIKRQAVRLDSQRIDDELDQLFAFAALDRFQHGGNG